MSGTGALPDDSLATEADVHDLLLLRALARFRGLDREDLERLPPPRPLIDGLLPQLGLGMLAGARGLGKTLLAMDWAGHVATDLPMWQGMEVPIHGPVLYVSLEGFPSIPNRLRAWEHAHNRRVEGITFVRDQMNLRRDDHATDLGTYAQQKGAVLIVIDSARAAGAGKEDTQDMGNFVRGLETVQAIAGGLVLVLHNSGWNGERERGSTLLPDACDTTLILTGDPRGIRELEHRKHRDGDMLDAPLHFAFRKIEDTDSGILTPADFGQRLTMQDQLLAIITANPGQSTSALVAAIGKDRANVSNRLSAMSKDSLIRNYGSTQRPQWVIAGEALL